MIKIKCEIYSRVVGYYRPVDQWNAGKQAEFWDRKNFKNLPVYIEESTTIKVNS